MMPRKPKYDALRGYRELPLFPHPSSGKPVLEKPLGKEKISDHKHKTKSKKEEITSSKPTTIAAIDTSKKHHDNTAHIKECLTTRWPEDAKEVKTSPTIGVKDELEDRTTPRQKGMPSTFMSTPPTKALLATLPKPAKVSHQEIIKKLRAKKHEEIIDKLKAKKIKLLPKPIITPQKPTSVTDLKAGLGEKLVKLLTDPAELPLKIPSPSKQIYLDIKRLPKTTHGTPDSTPDLFLQALPRETKSCSF